MEDVFSTDDIDDIQASVFAEVKEVPHSASFGRVAEHYGAIYQNGLPGKIEVQSARELGWQVPRRYQELLCEKAKRENVIAVMDTGTGKTLIAILLIREMGLLEEVFRQETGRKRMTFFLVPLVALVQQQAIAIESNCSLSVGHVSGHDNVDTWNEAQWRDWYEDYDVCVMTVDILSDCLNHGFVHMKKINLIIFDEAHHAKRGNSMASIMKVHYQHAPPCERPKIFGMTATPVDSRRSVHAAGSALEETLDAKIFTAPPNVRKTISQWVTKPSELIVPYDPPKNVKKTTPLLSRISAKCGDNKNFKRVISMAQYALEDLGTWCSDQVWYAALEDFDRRSKGLSHGELLAHVTTDTDTDDALVRETALREIQMEPERPLRFDDVDLTPKVLCLIAVLNAFRPLAAGFCGIVFVERKLTAKILKQVIAQSPVRDFIRPEAIVGTGNNGEQGDLMTSKVHARILQAFRARRCNLLLATSVIEEGLDVQPCNLIIRFDLFSTQISYIQSRGRARAKHSRYICMVERGNRTQYRRIADIPSSEIVMKQWIDSLPADRKAPIIDPTALEMDDEDAEEDGPDDVDAIYREPSTGAVLTYGNSISLLNHYCATLPCDGMIDTRPVYTLQTEAPFVMSLDLPAGAHISHVQSAPMSTARLAKKAVAYQACRMLRKMDILDDHLLPPRWERDLREGEREIDSLGLVVGARKSRRVYSRRQPAFWSKCISTQDMASAGKIFVTMIDFGDLTVASRADRYRNLAICTTSPLPADLSPVNIYLSESAHKIHFRRLGSCNVSEDQRHAAYKYTMRILSAIVNREWQCELPNLPFMLLPLKTTDNIHTADDIAWDEILRGAFERLYPLKDYSEVDDSILIDTADVGRRYYALGLRFDLSPLSPPPSTREAGHENIASWYSAHSKRWNCKDMNQPLIAVSKISQILSFTVRNTIAKKSNRTEARFVIPEFVKLYSVKASVFRSARTFPSILRHLDQHLLARDLNALLDLNVDHILLTTAISCPSSSSENNYERLEFLGDSLLKVLATMKIMACNQEKHEGELHCARIRVVCNKALFKQGVARDLPSFVQSHGFARGLFRPSNFKLPDSDEKTPPDQLISQELGDKTIADVVEAIAGAAYLSSGMSGGFAALKALGIEFAHFEKYEDFFIKSIQEPRGVLSGLRQDALASLEDTLGYVFRDKRYLVEAMTHSSLPGSTLPCYQRLEHLGDAVLDWQVVRYLFVKYPDRDPANLTMMKSSMVTNKILGALCYELGLKRYISHTSSMLLSSMSIYAAEIEEQKSQEEKLALSEGRPVGEWWLENDPPKVMADVIESLLGAVFLDSRCNLEIADSVFDKLVKPFLDTYVTPETFRPHPVARLVALAQSHPCIQLECRRSPTSLEVPAPEDFYDCPELAPPQKAGWYLHNLLLDEAERPSLKLARLEAAKLAVARLQKQRGLLEEICTCSQELTVRELERVEVDPDDLIISLDEQGEDASFALL